MEDVKLIHVTVMDGNVEQIGALRDALDKIKKKLPYKVEFFISNDKIELKDIKFLIEDLYKLYKLTKEGEKK